MDEYKLSAEWVDRIFHRLKEIYAKQFEILFSDDRFLSYQKDMFRSGLYNLTPDEIKHAIECCRNGQQRTLPHVMDFYHLAKTYLQNPAEVKVKETLLAQPADKEIAKKFINDIKDRLNAKTRVLG